MPQKWESCVKKVKAKQSQWCADNKYPRAKDPSGKKCYNPYAICNRLRGSSPSPSRKIYIGPRGGKYYLSPSGKKVYVRA